MNWSVVVLTDAQTTALLHYQLETRFNRTFRGSAKHEGAAMFRERDPAGGLHKFYFSPQATEILKEELASSVYPLRECSAPSRDEVAFVAGDPEACLLLHK